MIDLLKKSAACAFAIISAVFTFVPEAIFGKVILISEDVLKQFTLEGYTLEINIIVNRILTFVIVHRINKIQMVRNRVRYFLLLLLVKTMMWDVLIHIRI